MKSRITLFASPAITIAILLASSSIASAQGVKLKWKFNPGDVFELEMQQEQVMAMDLGAAKMNTTNKNSSWMTWKVAEVSGSGEATINTKIDRMKLDMTTPAGNMSFDSDSKEEPQGQAAMIAGIIKPIVGVEMSQQMMPSGKINSVKMPDAVKNMMGKMGPGGSEMIESISKNATLEFPEKPLVKGDSWTAKVTTASPVGKMSVESTYTYDGVVTKEEKELHVFDVDLKMEFPKDGAQLGATIDISNQKTDGKMYFDAERGRLDHTEMKQSFDMNINANGQKIKQSMQQNITMRFQDV